MKTVSITCENTRKDYQVLPGTTLQELQKTLFPENRHRILGALVNNQLQDLQYVIMAPLRVNFIDTTTLDGYSIYSRSLIFVLYRAINLLFPKKKFRTEYFISNGI
ncbi:MAG: nucleoside kinase, partial [Odoribacter sp.]|nr:nucleoside kinase [Odoribacter sp.]